MLSSATVPSKTDPVTRSDDEENGWRKEKQDEMAQNKKHTKYIIPLVCLVDGLYHISSFFANDFYQLAV